MTSVRYIATDGKELRTQLERWERVFIELPANHTRNHHEEYGEIDHDDRPDVDEHIEIYHEAGRFLRVGSTSDPESSHSAWLITRSEVELATRKLTGELMSGFDWVRNTEQAHIRLGDQYRWYALRLTAQRLTNALKTDRDGNYHWDEQYQLPDLYSFRSAEREFRKSTQFYSDALLSKLGKAFSALVKEASQTVQKTVQAAALKDEEDLTPIRFDPASASLLVAVRDTINTVFPTDNAEYFATWFQASHRHWRTLECDLIVYALAWARKTNKVIQQQLETIAGKEYESLNSFANAIGRVMKYTNLPEPPDRSGRPRKG